MIQTMLTPAAGKRLIATAMAVHPAVRESLKSGTVVIVAGTTNGYIAEEILRTIGQSEGFARKGFFRGVTVPPSVSADKSGRQPDERTFSGDVVIVKGRWQNGKTLFDVADDLKEGDTVLKGANAVDIMHKRAAILIGDQKGGTILTALQAMIGRRVRLIIPVGLEKRVSGSLDELAAKINAPGVKGLRFLPVPGEVITEIEAISILSGAKADLFAAGGVAGAEGCVWLAVTGKNSEETAIRKILAGIVKEEPFDPFCNKGHNLKNRRHL